MTTTALTGTRTPSIVDAVAYLAGVGGSTACLTILWLSMRVVMDIGGACADGGPFVPAQRCPEGVPILLTLAMFGLFGFGGLVLWKGSVLGGRFAAVVALAWPALFLSLGWNFLEYGIRPPGGEEGVVWGWLIPGVLFMLMGGGPVVLALRYGASETTRRATRSVVPARRPSRRDAPTGRTGEPSTSPEAPRRARTTADEPTDRAPGDARPTRLVDGLERLAALHASGSLTDAEFAAAKDALIAEVSRG